MADNFNFTEGAGKVAAAADIGGVLHQQLIVGGDYEFVAASQTNQVCGASGAVGDYLSGVLIIPGSTSANDVQIKDGSNTAITIFSGGVGSLGSKAPFYVPIQGRSTSGAWQITTGSGVTAIAQGIFS